MSNGRNCDRDRATTLNVIEGRCRAVEEGANENWLGHGIHTGAAHIDELLFQGATYDELDQQAGRGAVDEHLRSLRRTRLALTLHPRRPTQIRPLGPRRPDLNQDAANETKHAWTKRNVTRKRADGAKPGAASSRRLRLHRRDDAAPLAKVFVILIPCQEPATDDLSF